MESFKKSRLLQVAGTFFIYLLQHLDSIFVSKIDKCIN